MRWVTLAIAFGIGCSGDPQRCEQAVRNYASLVYWKEAESAIAAAAPEQRQQVRREKLAEFQTQLGKGLKVLISQCTSANNKDQITCMIAAKTAEQAKECSGQ